MTNPTIPPPAGIPARIPARPAADPTMRRRLLVVPVLAAALLASGCATLNTVATEVTRYAQWPADRKPGTYSFERLPSQQAQPNDQAPLEEAAARALEGAGFTRVAPGSAAEYRIQVGARLIRNPNSQWVDDWPHGPWGPWGVWGRPLGRAGWYGPGVGVGFGWSMSPPRYDREVGLLIRDGRNGTPLYETRAASEGTQSFSAPLLGALFEASMRDFPAAPAGPQVVRVELPR